MDILVGDALMVRGFGLGFLEWTICGFARGYVMDFLVGDYFQISGCIRWCLLKALLGLYCVKKNSDY
jgi:hypothetical protein